MFIRTCTHFLVLSAAALVAASAGGCSKKQVLVQPPVPVTITEALSRDVPIELQQIGTVEAFSTVSITSRVTGQLLKVAFKEGRDVTKGEVLFQIDPAPFQAALAQARANLERDRAIAQNALADVSRYQSLVDKEYITKQQYESAIATAKETQAMVTADSAQVQTARLNLDYCTIRAPISGRTGTVLIREGNMVVANSPDPLVTINQISPVYVQFSIPGQNLPLVRSHSQDATLKVWVMLPPDSTKTFDGTLTFIDNKVDETTGTIVLKATFPNKNRALWPGQFVRIGLTLGMQMHACLVPSSAVQVSQQGDYLYVVMPGDTVQMRLITKGISIGEMVVIEKGLASGEKIVTDGQMLLRQGLHITNKAVQAPAPSMVKKS